MENPQYNLCGEVLRRLDQEGVLDHVVLIGSWCLLAYVDYFKDIRYRPALRTRDIDILVPVPLKFNHKVDMELLLKDLDFVRSFKGRKGYLQFVHQDLMLEFIVPERGRGSDKPFAIPNLGINAQPLRFMDFLADNVVRLRFAGLKVSVPHPVNFALLKVIVAGRRKMSGKKENDLRQAVGVMRALVDSGEKLLMKEVFLSCPVKWQKMIIKTLRDQPLAEGIVSVLE